MDQRIVCCVCEKPIEGEPMRIGNRPYCAADYAKVTRNRRGLWWASLVGIGVLVVFVILATLIFQAVYPQLEESGAVPYVGVIIALVPALIWLAFFYLQDVREPEPKGLVAGVFVLGALVAQAVGIPLIQQVFRTPEWLSASPGGLHILGAILIPGFIGMFLIYAVVRYTVYNSAEFDERVDGVVYTVAAALGYATVMNIHTIQSVVQAGSMQPAPIVLGVAENAMAMAAFGGILGFFVGRCKFEDEPVWWMPAGLALVAVLNGLYIFFLDRVTAPTLSLAGSTDNSWAGLGMGAVVAGVTFIVLFYLIQRLGRQAPQVSEP
jgi:RsiW-degrading membrane proteinase PrsW (M82 family)